VADAGRLLDGSELARMGRGDLSALHYQTGCFSSENHYSARLLECQVTGALTVFAAPGCLK
jgi:hypothetical protein